MLPKICFQPKSHSHRGFWLYPGLRLFVFPQDKVLGGELLCGFNYQEMVRDKFLRCCIAGLPPPPSSAAPTFTASLFSAAQPPPRAIPCTGGRWDPPQTQLSNFSFCKKTCKKPSSCAAKPAQRLPGWARGASRREILA